MMNAIPFKRKYSILYGTNPVDGKGYYYVRDHTSGSWSWVTKEGDHLHCLLFEQEEDALLWIAEHGVLIE